MSNPAASVEPSPSDRDSPRANVEPGDVTRAHHAYLTNLRHELRTPINAIIGYSEMLLDDLADQGHSESLPDLQKVHAAGQLLLTRVNELLDPTALSARVADLHSDAFGVTLRHELRTPINAIIGYTEMLLEDLAGGDENIFLDLQKILEAARRFLAFINTIVAFSQDEDPGAVSLETAAGAAGLAWDAVSAIRSLQESYDTAAAGVAGRILVVDDNAINRDVLTRRLVRQGHSVAAAENGRQALEMLRAEPYDLVLLDIMMPELNGYEVLQRLKADVELRELPVIMISALTELDTMVRCIEAGAEDYLPKPFNPVVLRARIGSSLERKRLRDRERAYIAQLQDYVEQAQRVTAAAAAVETATFEPSSLESVAQRGDELGQLARVFRRMADEVHAREQRLKFQLQQLRLDMEERTRAAAEILSVYVPMDRRQALARGESLRDRPRGAALFADVSGFTPLTETLARELGLERGAEEMTRQLNRVFGRLIERIHNWRGSVIAFSGDAITCWFEDEHALKAAAWRAVSCASAIQEAMREFETITTPRGTTHSLAVKVSIAAGDARRFLAGDPSIQHLEVLAGGLLDAVAAADRSARRGEVLVHADAVTLLGEQVSVVQWREDSMTKRRAAVVSLIAGIEPTPWPLGSVEALSDTQVRPWVLPVVVERIRRGMGDFLSELRTVTVLFLKFGGLDYDSDDAAGKKLDEFVRWLQAIMTRHKGSLLQVTMGDKGSYVYAVFGAPIAHDYDAARAVAAALELKNVPPELAFVTGVQIGLAQGLMRVGSYGGEQRTYGVIGDKTNLAARLMQSAVDDIWCDEAVYHATRERFEFRSLPAIKVKGKQKPVAVYRPVASTVAAIRRRLDGLPLTQQVVLKVASVIGPLFTSDVLHGVFPSVANQPHLTQQLADLEQQGWLARPDEASPVLYRFRDSTVRETIYDLMLFSQRRRLHRAVAEWYEHAFAAELSQHYPVLAHHWQQAEEIMRATDYYEKAGAQARQAGNAHEAEHYFSQALALAAQLPSSGSAS